MAIRNVFACLPLDSVFSFSSGFVGSEYRTVKLQKSERGYGFSIVGGLDETGADFPLYVKEVVPGSVADESGELHRGDQLVAINGQKLEGLSCKAASQIIFDSTSEELALTLLSLLSE